MAHSKDLVRAYLQAVVYRQSISQKFQSFREVQLANARAENRVKHHLRQHEAKKRAPTSVDSVLLANLKDHLATVGQGLHQCSFKAVDGRWPLEVEPLSRRVRAAAPVVVRESLEAGADEQKAVEQDDEQPTRVFFRILKTGVGNMKQLQTFVQVPGERLRADDMAVTLHSLSAVSTLDEPIVEEMPCLDSSGLGRILLLKAFNDGCLGTLRENLQGWQGRSIVFSFKSAAMAAFDPADVHEAIVALLECGATPDGDGTITWPSDIADGRPVWGALQAARLIQKVDPDLDGVDPNSIVSYALTDSGFQGIRISAKLRDPVFLAEPRRGLDHPALTPYELGCLLEEQGFQWRLLPQNAIARRRFSMDNETSTSTFFSIFVTHTHMFITHTHACLLHMHYWQFSRRRPGARGFGGWISDITGWCTTQQRKMSRRTGTRLATRLCQNTPGHCYPQSSFWSVMASRKSRTGRT